MRKTLTFILSFLIFSTVNAQVKRQFSKVKNSVISQKFHEIVIENKNSKKVNDCLNYNCTTDPKLSYCDDKSDENYTEFVELGIIKNSEIIVINKITYNEDSYILINQKECKQIELKGLPLKIENSNRYMVYNNPSTDNPYSIQIVDIENSMATILDEIILPKHIIPKRVLRIEKTEIYILDNNNLVWKAKI